eukprot:TRINITY_DN3480_c0_g1_i1.p1 TRINITY_DN3480_c0_g1~~TRINITY_DN3480_c0_g1_i1.p1  ORF type:complete len:513 (+),score=160.47 TRINITY_DN3480_c0_g1_i1:166-1539(+)
MKRTITKLDSSDSIKAAIKRERGYISLSESGYRKRIGDEKESIHRYQENIKFLDSEIALLVSKQETLAEDLHEEHVLKLKEELRETLSQGERSVECFQTHIVEERRKKNRLHREKTKKVKKVEFLKKQISMLQDGKIPNDLTTHDPASERLRAEIQKIVSDNQKKIKIERRKLQQELDVTTKLRVKNSRLNSQVATLKEKLASCQETTEEKKVIKSRLLVERKEATLAGERELVELEAKLTDLNAQLEAYNEQNPLLSKEEKILSHLVSKEKAKIAKLQASIKSMQMELSLNYNQSLAALREEISDMRELWVSTLSTALSSPSTSDDETHSPPLRRTPPAPFAHTLPFSLATPPSRKQEKSESPLSPRKFPAPITQFYKPKAKRKRPATASTATATESDLDLDLDSEAESQSQQDLELVALPSTSYYLPCDLISLSTCIMYVLALAVLAYQGEAFSF